MICQNLAVGLIPVQNILNGLIQTDVPGQDFCNSYVASAPSAAMAAKLPSAGGIGVRGFPLQAVQNVHLRDACALTARGGEGLGPANSGAVSSAEDRFQFL